MVKHVEKPGERIHELKAYNNFKAGYKSHQA